MGIRADAIEEGLDRYFTDKPCRHGHVAERYTANGQCVECGRLRQQTPEYKAARRLYAQTPARKAYMLIYGRNRRAR
jgi:hypothetical protein